MSISMLLLLILINYFIGISSAIAYITIVYTDNEYLGALYLAAFVLMIIVGIPAVLLILSIYLVVWSFKFLTFIGTKYFDFIVNTAEKIKRK